MTEEQAIERIDAAIRRHLPRPHLWSDAMARDDELEGLHKACHMFRQTPPHLAVKA